MTVRLCPVVVGREEEVRELRSALRDARAGKARSVLLRCGPRGRDDSAHLRAFRPPIGRLVPEWAQETCTGRSSPVRTTWSSPGAERDERRRVVVAGAVLPVGRGSGRREPERLGRLRG